MTYIDYRHVMTDEDGIGHVHPGYEERVCPCCKEKFLAARTTVICSCGGKDCGKEKV